MSEVKFPEGIKAFKPNEKAPSFIKVNLSLNKADLTKWLSTQGDTIKLDVKESAKGTYYLSVNDYTPAQKDAIQSAEYSKKVAIESDEDSLPF